MAKLASEFGLTKAVVRKLDEANEIRGYFREIIILGDRAVAHPQFSFTLNSMGDILRAERGSTVELKVDTGMHRNGISTNELETALQLIESRGLHLKGVMSHNRSADELSSELFWQYKRFEFVKQRVQSLGFKNIRFHSFNSASTLRMDSKNEDLIRLGIGAYGYNELPKVYGNSIKLKPVLSLWANRVSTRKLKKGARVGYGGSFVAPKDMIVSTYDLGYGDGWMRSDSFKPFITAEGLPILGRVSMDYISLESTKERVSIFNNAKYAGEQLGTIPYEILTQLSNRLEVFS
jgi:alanine racemase